jgi:ketosteroid isomerase-like protein
VVPAPGLAGAGPYRGRDEIQRAIDAYLDSFVEVDIPVAHLLTVRDGRVIRFEVFIDREQTRTAAGLAD